MLVAIISLDLLYIAIDYLFRFTYYNSVKNTIGSEAT